MSYSFPTDIKDCGGNGKHPILCSSCAATGAWVRSKRLITRGDVDQYLTLSSVQTQWLINTHQITAIRMRGEDRFDSRELDSLIETYKETARKRA